MSLLSIANDIMYFEDGGNIDGSNNIFCILKERKLFNLAVSQIIITDLFF